ncbi:RNA polymerase sigma factor [Steroidobacter sp.]|uniref:RNA polymerase sigma factor n=1 Tax=Steroidobacter sp. TaxID=1978227 RepID=UPI001A5A4CB2|nr:RNA polymerase sigma factor [Steroidobacter sp.]MBL8269848.1 RNA polymerase sigma factor [Steroidobacter sp.]
MKSAPAGDDEQASGAGQYRGRLAELFAAHNRALMRFLVCRLRSPQEAEEVAQEAYVRMLQLDRPDGVSYLQAFLFKTAANLAADRLKSSARRGRLDGLDFFEEAPSSPPPENGVAARQEIDRVLQVIEELPAKCRYAFIMHRFYGHELQDIARQMNLTERMVRNYVTRALTFCAERLRTGESE